ncbi:Ger(x)C family spore germination C-terminal domain-containing protein, partial [Peribacillus butanolivorans]
LRSDFYIVVAKGMKAAEILKVPTSLEKIPANQIFDTLKVSATAWSATSFKSLDELISDIVSEGKQPVLTGIQADIKGDEETSLSKQNVEMIDPPALLRFNGLAVFNDDKLVGWLNEKQSKTYTVITNKEQSTVVNISCPKGGKAAYEVKKSSTKIKGKLKNGKPEIDLNIRVEGNLGEVECHIDLTKPETIEKLEKIYEKEAKKFFMNSIKQV